jgi:hypothetical protein
MDNELMKNDFFKSLPEDVKEKLKNCKSEEEAMDIAGAFGGGMGNMEGTCGALVGAGLVLGLVNKDKAKSMKQMRQIMT